MQASRRQLRACRLVAAAAALSLATLLFLTAIPSAFNVALPQLGERKLLVPPRRLPLSLLGAAVRSEAAHDADDAPADAVLLPDWEVLVVLHPNATAPSADDDATTRCVFRRGAASPARALGTLPSSGRRAYVCAMPEPAGRRLPLHAPRIVTGGQRSGPPREHAPMLSWSGRLVYDAVVVDGGDVLVFAKGVNPRQGVNRAASDVRCVYYRNNVADVVASLPAATSAQQVFRCPPPPSTSPLQRAASSELIRVTLAVAGEKPLPSLATYNNPPSNSPVQLVAGESATATAAEKSRRRSLICACTMVRDVAKFLREWVVYHAAVGVDRFFIYDNGSEDDLAGQVRQLSSEGFNISTLAWPWPKTQEAGFSHSAAVHRDSCEWMAFIDVDEFIFSPQWAKSGEPTKSMLRSVVHVEPDVGQVSLGCVDFGPSGRTAHPKEGLTQGYTFRRRTRERHKSLVRLDAVDLSLVNSVHHFVLRPEARGEWNRRARVNHYKYQAWEEFKVKFRRRVSSYVVDWTNRVNAQSKDRTPGLGFEAVEPDGWANKFCEVEDTLLRNVSRRWFGNTLQDLQNS